MVTLHGTVANVGRLPAGSVSVAVTSFWPGSKSTAANVATPLAKAGFVYVSVVAPFVTWSDDAAGLGGERHGLRERSPDDWWKLPQRFAGVCSVSTGGTVSTQTSTGMLVPMLIGLTASATRTRSSVGVARVPFVFSMLFGKRHAGEARDEAEARRAVVGGDGGDGRDRRADLGAASRR